jgi:hypothetical protein
MLAPHYPAALAFNRDRKLLADLLVNRDGFAQVPERRIAAGRK